MSRGQRVIDFIHRFCVVPEGTLQGQPVKLLPFQEKFIRDIYDNVDGTSRAYLSMARKNGKTATIAMILLAHMVGPEAYQNSRIISGARTRKQASEVYNYAYKMVLASPALRKIVRPVPSQKILTGLPMNVEYQAISADAAGAHGGSPILAILDEVGQVRGPTDAFVEAIETSQGAYEDKALLIAISTQAATDGDLFSKWLDDAETSKDPRIVSHLYTTSEDCDLLDEKSWKAANPALGKFRSVKDVRDFAKRAAREPSSENSFRWLYLNQRIEANAPFISKGTWAANGGPIAGSFDGPVYCGLDLSSARDLTAFVMISAVDEKWHIKPRFWIPGEGLHEKSREDRVPYDLWEKQGWIETTPGRSVQYEYVANLIADEVRNSDIRRIAFDRWGFEHLRPWLVRAGFPEDQLDGDDALFQEFGQGSKSMTPALRQLEADLLDGKMAHAMHPVLEWNARNATVVGSDDNRKLEKPKDRTRRIDGMAALAMARAVAGTFEDGARKPEFQMLIL
ncbi:terminase large subunit [Pelagibacterium sp.]|uniref:terminase large subunit n=1 Tax=Pelagibacterium sp. TaxID=1967288 RepID=UPI003A9170AC